MSPNDTTPGYTANPYTPPATNAHLPVYGGKQQSPLASRGTRLGAAILNNVLILPAIALVVVGMPKEEGQDPNTVMLGLAAVYAIALAIFQLKGLAQTGQTLGKKWLGIKVVRNDGSSVSLGRSFGLRELVNGIISAIPLLGGIYALVDVLCIFGDEKRCLHDKIADTKVVVA